MELAQAGALWSQVVWLVLAQEQGVQTAGAGASGAPGRSRCRARPPVALPLRTEAELVQVRAQAGQVALLVQARLVQVGGQRP